MSVCPVFMDALRYSAELDDDVESRADEIFNALSATELSELIDDKANGNDWTMIQAALCEFVANQDPEQHVAKQNALLAAVRASVQSEMLKRAGGQ
jgi:hypothetical protein